MRITGIEATPLDLRLQTPLTVAYGSYPELSYALLRIHTDEGYMGLGEASPDPEVTGETREGVLAALRLAGEFLMGQDPFNLDSIIDRCLEAIGLYPAAIAAIDMALFDLMGKSTGLPAFSLLGGRSRAAINLYPVIPLESPATMAHMASTFLGMGLRTLKIKLGSEPDTDLARLAAIRAAIQNAGASGVRLRLDVNQGWKDAATALRTIKAMDRSDLDWIEQPVAAADLEGLAEVSAAIDTPVMADESCHAPADALHIARLGAADMINIKLMKCGGLRQATKILAIAEAAGIRCILGSMGESSIGSAAGLHFMTAKGGIEACELIGPLFITNDPARGYPVDRSTFQATATNEPGLGVALA